MDFRPAHYIRRPRSCRWQAEPQPQISRKPARGWSSHLAGHGSQRRHQVGAANRRVVIMKSIRISPFGRYIHVIVLIPRYGLPINILRSLRKPLARQPSRASDGGTVSRLSGKRITAAHRQMLFPAHPRFEPARSGCGIMRIYTRSQP
jgi:hypothetical protein